jgi:hypothetical protein
LGVEPEGVVVLTGVAALDAEATVRRGERGSTMSGSGTKEQNARARARQARLTLLADRNAQDERIEAAVAAALLAWQDRTAAAGKVEEAERDTAAGLALLRREKVSVRDMATLTGIGESICSRLLKLPAADQPAKACMAPAARTPPVDPALAVLESDLPDPNLALRHQAKTVTMPGSDCLL